MEGRYLSRLIACSRCGLGVHDADGVTIRDAASDRVLEIVHESCLDGDEIARLAGDQDEDPERLPDGRGPVGDAWAENMQRQMYGPRDRWTGHVGPDAARLCNDPTHWRSNWTPAADPPLCPECGSYLGHFDDCPADQVGPSEPGGTSVWSGGAPL